VGAVRIDRLDRRADTVGAAGQVGIGQNGQTARRLDRLDNLGIARTIMGLPPISASGLFGKRVAAMRAGIIISGFIDLTTSCDARKRPGRLRRSR